MSSRPYSKRKRVVTACWECQRRKQKCNRERPCNHCISRNADDKCTYGTVTYAKAEDDGSASLASSSSHTLNDEWLSPAGIVDQIGYSAMTNENNPFMSLQKSLKRGNGIISFITVLHAESRGTCSKEAKAKFLHLLAQLPCRTVITELVELYFSELNCCYKIVERYFFSKDLAAWLAVKDAVAKGEREPATRDILYFTALIFQILAIQLQYLPPGTATANILGLKDLKACEILSHKYSADGQELMNMVGRQNSTITAVQYDLMRVFWLKSCSRGTAAWYSLGDAIRQAQDQGLHLQTEIHHEQGEDDAEYLEKLCYDEYKRRLWLVLFILDSFMALILGRPRGINLRDCTVKPPTDFDFPESHPRAIPAPPSTAPFCSNYTNFIFFYGIAQNVHKMLCMRAENNDTNTLHNAVLSLVDDLPPAMNPLKPDTTWDARIPALRYRRLTISCIFNTFLIALHRPNANTSFDSREAAVNAALRLLSDQHKVFKDLKPHMYKLYGLNFHTIDAAIFLSIITIERPPQDGLRLDQICTELQKAITRLGIMGERNPMGKSGSEILTQCYHRLQDTLQGPLRTGVVAKFEDQSSSDFDGQSQRTEAFMSSQLPDYPAHQYTPLNTLDAVPASQPMQPDMFQYGLDFNPSMMESMGFVENLGMDLYGNDLNWDMNGCV